MAKFDTIFVDSITVAGRLCFQWCQQQPEAKSDRTGKLDTRAAYGMHGREMMAWLTHLQHIREKNVIFVGILDEITDDYGRKQYALQNEGSTTGRELPGIVYEVITMAVLVGDNGPYRAFVCGALNEWGYPAKDRSGRLDTLEEPHLGKLMHKMSTGPVESNRNLEFVDPNTQNSNEGEVANVNLNNAPVRRTTNGAHINSCRNNLPCSYRSQDGRHEIPEFGSGQWFKDQPLQVLNGWNEFTVIGGEHDKRKFWEKIFVDGDKMGQSGIPQAKEMAYRLCARSLSANSLQPSDMSPEAQQRRNISGVMDLNGMEICAKSVSKAMMVTLIPMVNSSINA